MCVSRFVSSRCSSRLQCLQCTHERDDEQHCRRHRGHALAPAQRPDRAKGPGQPTPGQLAQEHRGRADERHRSGCLRRSAHRSAALRRFLQRESLLSLLLIKPTGGSRFTLEKGARRRDKSPSSRLAYYATCRVSPPSLLAPFYSFRATRRI